MKGRGTPRDNLSIIQMLSVELGRSNKKRNCILMLAVSVCIMTLTIVFGISFGKIKAEYIKSARAAGTTATACIEGTGPAQYEKVNTLSYVKKAGRRAVVGEAFKKEERICSLQVLDVNAWDEIVSPAYTDIYGHYPESEQELMLSVRDLEKLGIRDPKLGMEIDLVVNIGLFRTEEQNFLLSGWYTDYTEKYYQSGIGYISEDKYESWGYDLKEKADILICQTDYMDWQNVEERLHQDLSGNESDLRITISNTYIYDAIDNMLGSWGVAFFGAIVVLGGMFFLIYNVMQISMSGDVRQMGLLNVIGATQKQICQIYYRQIGKILVKGTMIGVVASTYVLLVVLPDLLGRQYLSRYGGAREFQMFHPEILLAAILFTGLLTIGASAGVIYRVVNSSCVESMHYTGGKIGKKTRSVRYKKRSADGELWYMAWQNVTRQTGKFVLTVCSLFLGIITFVGAVIVAVDNDYVHEIEKRPDFLIAGEFSEWGQEEGYGNEYKWREAGEDPLLTEANNLYLLDENAYDEFSPISREVREQLLSLKGVEEDTSYVMEGAYMISVISKKGLLPWVDYIDENNFENSMVEGFDADVIQILKEEEIEELEKYVEEKSLQVDMDGLKDGSSVIVLHDHALSPKHERLAEESVGEPLYFITLGSKEGTGNSNGKQSEMFSLGGYLDNRAEGFPKIRQTWHGSEGLLYYLISEKGFEKLPTEKKTLYMELEVDEENEPQIKMGIHNILMENEEIFCISKSDLLSEAKNYIQGNRIIMGSISAVLLLSGLTNYLNVMITGIISRKKELELMENIGMTKRQKQKLLFIEGLYYWLCVMMLLVVVSTIFLAIK